jgi:hypothetical protein
MKLFVALPLALAFACAGPSSSGNRSSTAANAQSCGQMVPAVMYRGSDLFAGPDSSNPPVTTVKEDTPVCASPESQGFGFRKVKLANGSTGFVTEASLSI